MDQREPAPKREFKPKPPKWTSPLWYLPLMLLLLWFWQSTISQFAYKIIPYSQFKDYVRNHQVISCVISTDDIQGQIEPKPAGATNQVAAAATSAIASSTTNTPAAAAAKPSSSGLSALMIPSSLANSKPLASNSEANAPA